MKKYSLSVSDTLYLRERGVDFIQINYSGGGDSGSIDEILFFKRDDEALSDDPYCGSSIDGTNFESSIKDKIENIGYDLLEGIGDWYNNDGGQGNLYISIPEATYLIEADFNLPGQYDEYGEIIEDGNDTYSEVYDGLLEKEL